MAYFPLFLDLEKVPCLVVGGGHVAHRKVMVLLDFGAEVTVIAEQICPEILSLDKVNTILGPYKTGACASYKLVIAATDDARQNHEIATYCKAHDILVNAVDQREDCSFIFPSYLREENLVAAFSSGGNSPTLTQYLREKEKEILTEKLGEINTWMGSIRPHVIAALETESVRKKAFEKLLTMALTNERILTEQEVDRLLEEIRQAE